MAPALADDAPTTRRRCRSPTASSTAATRAGRRTASASPTSATRTGAATPRSGCRKFFGGARTQVKPQVSLNRRRVRDRPASRPQDASGKRDFRARRRARQRQALAWRPAGLDARRRALRPRAVPERGALLSLPGGSRRLQRERSAGQGDDPGPERLPEEARHRSSASSRPAQTTELPVRLPDNDLPPEFGKFLSADLHVHMNYGGHYRNTPETPARAAGRRGPRRRLQPAGQQGRAHPGHRRTSGRAAARTRRAASACSSTRRSTTRASGATWAC